MPSLYYILNTDPEIGNTGKPRIIITNFPNALQLHAQLRVAALSNAGGETER